MNKGIGVLTGIGVGAGMMYMFDPRNGRRRRAMMADKLASAQCHLRREVDKAVRDVENRASGQAREVRRAVTDALSRRSEVDSDVLVSRVRAKLGRVVRSPHAVEVSADGSTVTLKGDVCTDEMSALERAVSAVPGVKHVKNELQTHEAAKDAPPVERPHRSDRWIPATRILGATAGGALAIYGAMRRGVIGSAATLAGSALLTRATANRGFSALTGSNGGSFIDLQKTVHIQAPVADVYRFLSDFTNLPRYMSHLREVRETGDKRYHWVADGPAGIPVTWDGEVTSMEENSLIEWRSLPGSAIVNSGTIRLEPKGDTGTRITVRVSYRPPAGVVGHTVASLFGADPKSEMDEDFVRLKSLIELGRTRVRGRRVTRDVSPAAAT